MINLYLSSDSEAKLKNIFCNIKNYFILDVDKFVRDMHLDLSKQSSIYLVNSEIERTILSLSSLKKYSGIIYINKNITKELHDSLKHKFSNQSDIGKIILIDNGLIPKHSELYPIFDEVIFYERFRKNKIVECQGFEPQPDNDSQENSQSENDEK